MDAVPLFLALVQCVMFFSDVINGEVDFSLNTSVYEGSDHYYAHVGKTVTLTCIFSKKTSSMVIYQKTSSSYDTLVKNEKLVTSPADLQGKYSYHSSSVEHNLTIYRLENSDSSYYGCRGCLKWVRCILFGWLGWGLVEGIVYLEVKNATDTSTLPDFCEFEIGNTNGIFFIGHDLTLRCPTNVTIATIGEISKLTNESEMAKDGPVFYLLVIKNLTKLVNDTRIKCFSGIQNGEIGKDYCRRLPQITVFDELIVKLTSGKHIITNGENATFTCESHPFLSFAVQWSVLDNDVAFGNFTIWETSQDSRLLVHNIDFRNSTSSSLTVVCNVTIGSVSRSKTASVHYEIHANYDSLTTIIFPVIGLIGILGIIISLMRGYNKVRKPENENVEVICQHTREKEKANLGLTIKDSEIADNVAYLSYDAVN